MGFDFGSIVVVLILYCLRTGWIGKVRSKEVDIDLVSSDIKARMRRPENDQ